jgi:hypothetical protein
MPFVTRLLAEPVLDAAAALVAEEAVAAASEAIDEALADIEADMLDAMLDAMLDTELEDVAVPVLEAVEAQVAAVGRSDTPAPLQSP